MSGLKSFTDSYIVGKKINGIWGEPKEGEKPIPKRQLILLSEDGAFTVNCTENVFNDVEEYNSYRFVLDTDVVNKKTKIVGVLADDK